MRTLARVITGLLVLVASVVTALPAQAIPAFSRIYGLECSACHSAYPALNALGEGFRLSGYRTFGGAEITPTVPPVKIGERLELPGVVPLSFSLKTGYNFNEVNNTLGDGIRNASADPEFKRSTSSFNLTDFEFDAGASLGKHLSFFLGAPLADTEIRQFFDPDVRNKGLKSSLNGPDVPELAFLGLHNILVPDLLNIKFGNIELPTAFSAEHRRLSFFPYLVYEATALDVISSGSAVDDLLNVPGGPDLDKNTFRLSNPQLGGLVYGRATPTLHSVANLNVDYFVGVVNGNNNNADNNKTKDVFGRLAGTYATGSAIVTVGGFGYYSGNTLDSKTTSAVNGAGFTDRLWRVGPDISVTLDKPLYINLFSQILFAEDTNPTGFNKKARWWGGFLEADVKPIEKLILYSRFDWIDGRRFDDTSVTINGASGTIGPVHPRLWDIVGGTQYFVWENFKLIAEYRRGEKDLRLSVADASQLKKTTENAVFTGFQMSF